MAGWELHAICPAHPPPGMTDARHATFCGKLLHRTAWTCGAASQQQACCSIDIAANPNALASSHTAECVGHHVSQRPAGSTIAAQPSLHSCIAIHSLKRAVTACLLSCVDPAKSGCAGSPRSPPLPPARSLPQNMMNPRSTDPTHQMRPVGSLLTAEAQNSPQPSPSFLPRPEPLPQSPNPQHQTSSPTHVL